MIGQRGWWSQRHKYLTEEELSACVDPARSGESAGKVGIGSECIDSAAHHHAAAQVQAQSPSGESPSSGAARAADAASAETAAVDAASNHASPAAAATVEGALVLAAATTGTVNECFGPLRVWGHAAGPLAYEATPPPHTQRAQKAGPPLHMQAQRALP